MPDPTAHADYMKSLAEPDNTLPQFWWLFPWTSIREALVMIDRLKAGRMDAIGDRIQAERRMAEAIADRNSLLLAMEREVKRIEGYPASENSIDLVKWAVDEVIDLRDSLATAKDGLDTMAKRLNEVRTERDAFERRLTEAREAHAHVYVELNKLKASIEENKKNPWLKDNLIEKLKTDLIHEKESVRNLRKYLDQTDRLLRKEQAKVNKLEDKLRKQAEAKMFAAAKAKWPKPLWEDKTKTLIHGAGITLGNHEDRHDPIREKYAALGREFIKARIKAIAKAKKAKAKKKGGSK